jgi:hypothetical protein
MADRNEAFRMRHEDPMFLVSQTQRQKQTQQEKKRALYERERLFKFCGRMVDYDRSEELSNLGENSDFHGIAVPPEFVDALGAAHEMHSIIEKNTAGDTAGDKFPTELLRDDFICRYCELLMMSACLQKYKNDFKYRLPSYEPALAWQRYWREAEKHNRGDSDEVDAAMEEGILGSEGGESNESEEQPPTATQSTATQTPETATMAKAGEHSGGGSNEIDAAMEEVALDYEGGGGEWNESEEQPTATQILAVTAEEEHNDSDATTETGNPDSKPSAAREEDRWQTLARAKPHELEGKLILCCPRDCDHIRLVSADKWERKLHISEKDGRKFVSILNPFTGEETSRPERFDPKGFRQMKKHLIDYHNMDDAALPKFYKPKISYPGKRRMATMRAEEKHNKGDGNDSRRDDRRG